MNEDPFLSVMKIPMEERLNVGIMACSHRQVEIMAGKQRQKERGLIKGVNIRHLPPLRGVE